MTKKLVGVLMLLCLLAACGDDDEGIDAPTQQIDAVDGDFSRIQVFGQDCIIYRHKASKGHGGYGYAGLSCDWSDGGTP